MSTVVVLVLVHDRTSSLTWLGLAAAARLLPYLVVSPVTGVIADRVDRRWLLQVAHVSRCAVALALVVAAVYPVPVGLLLALSFTLTACGTPCFPVALASLPQLVPGEELSRATGLISTVETAAFLAGPAIGGLLLAAASPAVALSANVLVLGAALAFVPTGLGRGDRSPHGPSVRGLVSDLAQGARVLVTSAPVRVSLTAVVVVNVMGGMISVLVLPIATDQLDVGTAGAGLLAAAFGGGSVLGAGLAAWRSGWSPVMTLALAGAPLALAAHAGPPALVGTLLVVAGLAATLLEVLMITRIQMSTPRAMVARVFGLFDAAAVAAVLAGATIAPAAVALLGLPTTLVLIGLVLPIPAIYGLRTSETASVRSAP